MKLKQERNEWSEKIGQLKMQSTEKKSIPDTAQHLLIRFNPPFPR
jgi:hypothetical protein